MIDQRLILKSPQTEAEWRDYYDLRWRILRAPWQQSRGTEQDEFEDHAYHVMATDQRLHILGVGRIHQVNDQIAQIRYMATVESSRGHGIGTIVLNALEQQAQNWGVSQVILNARAQAVRFYERNEYQVIGRGETLFGEIAHSRMQKKLAQWSTAMPGIE